MYTEGKIVYRKLIMACNMTDNHEWKLIKDLNDSISNSGGIKFFCLKTFSPVGLGLPWFVMGVTIIRKYSLVGEWSVFS